MFKVKEMLMTDLIIAQSTCVLKLNIVTHKYLQQSKATTKKELQCLEWLRT